MIIPTERESWLRLVLTYRGSALPRIRGRLAAVFLVALAVTVAYDQLHVIHQTVTVVPFSLVGLALGIFLGFRNNTSYDRFWEGRRLWGGLVNVTRSSARQAQLYLSPTALEAGPAGGVSDAARELTMRTIAYVHALRMHLRGHFEWDELAPRLPAGEAETLRQQRNVPIAILHGSALRLRRAFVDGQVDAFHLPVLEGALADMTDIQGGCERIKKTPIPHSYTVLIHRIVALYCFALPFGLVDTLHGWTPLVVIIVSYAFLGLDAVGDEIADPFGLDDNDLPLGALCVTIEGNLLQSLGETELPPEAQPIERVLL